MELALFFAGGIVAAVVLFRFNQTATHALKRLEDALRNEGLEWRYLNDFEFRKKLLTKPSSILNPQDSVLVLAAKQELLSIREKLPHAILRGVLCLVLGLVAAMIAGLVSFYLKR